MKTLTISEIATLSTQDVRELRACIKDAYSVRPYSSAEVIMVEGTSPFATAKFFIHLAFEDAETCPNAWEVALAAQAEAALRAEQWAAQAAWFTAQKAV